MKSFLIAFSLSVFLFPALLFGQTSEPFPKYYPELWALRYDSSDYVRKETTRLLEETDSAEAPQLYHELLLTRCLAAISDSTRGQVFFNLMLSKDFFRKTAQLTPKTYSLLGLIEATRRSDNKEQMAKYIAEIQKDSARLNDELLLNYQVATLSLYLRENDMEAGLKRATKILTHKNQLSAALSPNMVVGFYVNSALLYMHTGNFKEGYILADSAIKLSTKSGVSHTLKPFGRMQKAYIYMQEEKYPQALQTLQQIDTSGHFQATKAGIFFRMSEPAAQMGDYKKAYQYIKEHLLISPQVSVENKQAALIMERIQKRHTLDLKELEVKQERQQRYLYTAASSALLLLVLSLFLLLRLRIRKQKHERLAYDLRLKQAEISERQKQHELEASQLKNKQLHLEKEKQDAELAEQEAIQVQMKLREEQLTLMQAQAEKELSILSLSLLQRNDFFDKTATELKTALAVAENTETKKVLRRLTRKLKSQLNLEEGWEQFRMHFEHAHNGFFENLQHTHENRLTESDLKLAAFLKMHLNSKEISLMLGISSASVDNARHRLRKKMNLDKGENLIEYIAGF